jgi:hypothetical protein
MRLCVCVYVKCLCAPLTPYTAKTLTSFFAAKPSSVFLDESEEEEVPPKKLKPAVVNLVDSDEEEVKPSTPPPRLARARPVETLFPMEEELPFSASATRGEKWQRMSTANDEDYYKLAFPGSAGKRTVVELSDDDDEDVFED